MSRGSPSFGSRLGGRGSCRADSGLRRQHDSLAAGYPLRWETESRLLARQNDQAVGVGSRVDSAVIVQQGLASYD
jgi:hypothetical protein